MDAVRECSYIHNLVVWETPKQHFATSCRIHK